MSKPCACLQEIAAWVRSRLAEPLSQDGVHELLDELMGALQRHIGPRGHGSLVWEKCSPTDAEHRVHLSLLEQLTDLCFDLMNGSPDGATRLSAFVETHFGEAPASASGESPAPRS